MKEVFNIWRSYFDFSHYEETSFYHGDRSRTNPTRIERLWKWMCHAILHTPIMLPDGTTWEWIRNGFGSGFQMTQLMDSFANAIMLCTCLAALGIKIEHEHFWIRVQGDDSIVAFCEAVYGPTFLLRLEEVALKYFNAKLNIKKSKCSTDFEGHSILGYLIRNQMPYRTEEDLLRHLLFPETERNTWNRQISVFIGLAYASCGTNERFFTFAEYCFNRLKQRGNVPEPRHIKWLVRSGQVPLQDWEAMEFPNRFAIQDQVWWPTEKGEAERQRMWPTQPGPRGRFFFFEL